MPVTEGGSGGNWGELSRYGEFEIVGAAEGKPRLLGKGSFGKTFEAMRTDSAAGKVITSQFALKVLNPALLAGESKRFQFIQEINALKELDHPNLIHYVRAGEERGEVYYAMRLCRGGDLARMVRKFGPLPEKVIALIGLQIASGLHTVHQRHRLVHRDIKPSNVMLQDDVGEGGDLARLHLRFEEDESLCRIVDFGLVDFTRNAQEHRAKFVGSPMYASPEQIREQPVDGRTDIYSLGMTLWFLAQGKGPLLDEDGAEIRDQNKAMGRHLAEEEHRDALPRHLSEQFRNILARMVAKRPEERYGSAREVQAALREYLDSPACEQQTRMEVACVEETLEAAFEVERQLGTRGGWTTYVAKRRNAFGEGTTGPPVRLTVLSPIPREARHEKAMKLCEAAWLSQLPGVPPALLAVREVIEAADHVGFTEELAPGVSLADVLRVRAQARRIPFAESVAILGPIAEGLDFLLRNKRVSHPISCDEIWLGGISDPAETLHGSLTALEGLRPCLSMMYLPPDENDADADASPHGTISGSVQLSEAERHPVPAFARLIYRVLSGSEIAAAAHFIPNAYVPTVALSAASNNLLRGVVSQQQPWNTASEILTQLCDNEGVVWRPQKRAGGTAPSTRSAGTGPTARSTATTGTTTAGTTTAAGASGTAHGTHGTHGTSGGTTAERRREPLPRDPNEKTCEVVQPGIVRSPYDSAQREQTVAAEDWVPSGRVRCQFTQRVFRLPRRLGNLYATIVSPGVIHSPYAVEGETQRVSWEDWQGGAEIVCAESGRRIVLPEDLPRPEGIIPGYGTGIILSPYAAGAQVKIDAEHWRPGTEVICPATRLVFALPSGLPPLAALVDPARPGIVATPYAKGVDWQIPPGDWQEGRAVTCPVTRQPLKLPREVESWPVQGEVLDPARRLVSNPCRPGSSVEVPRASWQAGQRVTVPGTARPIILPPQLPPLVGTAIDERPGVVISPYSDEEVSVSRADWIAGGRVKCPQSDRDFILPARLPEWLTVGSIAGLPAGQVRSPFAPGLLVQVPPNHWKPNEVVICPQTQRNFRLPAELPLLEGLVERGRPGVVLSPFSVEWQDVSLDEWVPEQRLRCAVTAHPFKLPKDLEEWVVEGQWVEGSEHRIRSPFSPHREMDLTRDQMLPGHELFCPATRRRFRVPAIPGYVPVPMPASPDEEPMTIVRTRTEVVPQEILAEQTLAEPAFAEQTVAEQTLAEEPPPGSAEPFHPSYPGEKEATVRDHEPGVAYSPYGHRVRIEVPPDKWEPHTHLVCPETRQQCTLPGRLPLLRGTVVPGRPGYVISPFRPGCEVRVPRRKWRAGEEIICTETARPFALPAPLPDWPATHLNIPWSKIGMAAAGLAVLVGLGVAVGKWIQDRPDNPTGGDSPTNDNERSGLFAVREPKAVLDGGLEVADWMEALNPEPRVYFAGTRCEDVELTPSSGNRGFRVSVKLPKSAAGRKDCMLSLRLPGWEPLNVTLAAGSGGDFVSREKQVMQRRKVRLPLSVPSDGTDYEVISAKWSGPLPDEPHASSPLPSSIVNIPVSNLADEHTLPSGKYSLTLTGRDASGPVKPYQWKPDYILNDKPESLELPKTIVGDRFGMLTSDPNQGTFFLLKIQRGTLAVELQEIELPKGPEFRASNGRPHIGGSCQVPPSDISLVSPVKLVFKCPLHVVNATWVYEAQTSKFPRLSAKPEIPGSEAELRRNYEAMKERFIKDADRAKRENDEDKYRDFGEFKSAGFKIDRLYRYEHYLKTPAAYDKEINILKWMVGKWRELFGNTDLWFWVYPASDTLSLEPMNANEWDVRWQPR